MSEPPSYQRDPSHADFVATQLRERSRAAGERPVAVVRARATQRFQIEAEADGFPFRSDESVHGGGDGSGLAPLRYFIGGYLCCHLVWCIKMAAVLGVRLTRAEGEATGMVGGGTRADLRISADEARAFTRVRSRLQLDTDGSTSDEVREVVLQAAYRCPAAVTLWKAVPLEVEIVHNGASLAPLEVGSRGH